MAITRLGGANAITGIIPVANGGTGASSFSPGKILQVVSGETGTEVTHSTSYADTGLSASITPSSTSNKILILVTQHCFWTNNGLTIQILRDTTSIFSQPVTYTLYDDNVSNARDFYPMQYLDTPSSTSSITYKTQAKLHSSGTIKTQESSNKSRITLMEIAG